MSFVNIKHERSPVITEIVNHMRLPDGSDDSAYLYTERVRAHESPWPSRENDRATAIGFSVGGTRQVNELPSMREHGDMMSPNFAKREVVNHTLSTKVTVMLPPETGPLAGKSRATRGSNLRQLRPMSARDMKKPGAHVH